MKKVCKYGFIEYREPNLEEGLRLMTSFADGKEGVEGITSSLDNLLALVTKVSLKIGDKKITTIEKLKDISRIEIMVMIAEMRIAVQAVMYDLEDEKKS